MKSVSDLDIRTASTNVYSIHHGAIRRAYILATVKWYMVGSTLPGLPVNNKYQWPITDPDLKYLLKKGKLKRIRHSTTPTRNMTTGLKRSGKGQTYLILG